MNEIEIIGDFVHNILEAWEMFFTVIDEMVGNDIIFSEFKGSLLGVVVKNVIMTKSDKVCV